MGYWCCKNCRFRCIWKSTCCCLSCYYHYYTVWRHLYFSCFSWNAKSLPVTINQSLRHTVHVKRVLPSLIKMKPGFIVFYRDLMSYWNWQKRATIAMLICWCETYMVVTTKCWDCLVTSLLLHLGKLCTATRIAISMQVRCSVVASM